MSKLAANFLLSVLVPFMFISQLSIVIGGIWLALDGVWPAVGWGLIYSLISAFALSIAMSLIFVLLIPAGMLYEKNQKVLSYIAAAPAILGAAYINSLFYFYVLEEFIPYASKTHPAAILLWSYGVATVALGIISSSSKANDGFGIFVLFTQLGFIFALIAIWFKVGNFALPISMLFNLVGIIIAVSVSISATKNTQVTERQA